MIAEGQLRESQPALAEYMERMSDLPGVADAQAKLTPLFPFNSKQLAHINNYDADWKPAGDSPNVEHMGGEKED